MRAPRIRKKKTNRLTSPTPALPRLAYTLKETAKILGISYISVHRLVGRHKLRCSNALPGRLLIPHKEIESFLENTSP